MKKRFRRLLAGALTVLMCGTAQAQVELFAVNVGKGDALIVRAGDYTCLIDTGKEKAQEQLEVALKALGVEALDAVFITHTDKDHTGGLKWLRESDIEIRAIYASRYYPNTTEKKHQAVKTAKKLDLTVTWLGAGDSVPLGIPNHGDSDAASAALIAACSPKVAVISTDSEEKPGTPDPGLLRNLEVFGCVVYVTQDVSLGVRVTLDGGEVCAEAVNP